MAITLPRYSQKNDKVPVIQAARNTTQASSGLSELGKSLMVAVESYGNMTTQVDAEPRQRDFENTVQLNSIQAEGAMNLKIQEYEQNNNWSTAGTDNTNGWEKDFDEFVAKQRKSFQKNMNEQEFAAFEPALLAQEMNGRVLVRKHRREATIKHSQYVIGEGLKTFQQSVEKAETVGGVMNAWLSVTGGQSVSAVTGGQTTTSPLSGNTFTTRAIHGGQTTSTGVLTSNSVKVLGVEKYNEIQNQSKELVNNKLIFLQAGGASKVQSPDGGMETDYATIFKNLKNPDVAIEVLDGKQVTVDDPIRKAMISEMKSLMEGQVTNHNVQQQKRGNEQFETYSQQINGLELGQTKDDAGNKLPSILQMKKAINEDEKLSDEQKDNLTNAITALESNIAAQLKNGLKSYETPQAKEYEKLVTILAHAGYLNTEAENKVLMQGYSKGLISSDKLKELVGITKTNIDKQTAIKTELTDRAVKMISRELGLKGDIMDTLLEANRGGKLKLDTLAELMRDPSNQRGYSAISQLYLLIAEGEKRGLSVEQMLNSDGTDPNNLPAKIIKVYKADMAELKSNSLKFQVDDIVSTNAAGKDFIEEGDARYRFDTKEYFNQITNTGTIDLQVPTMNDGETVAQYLSRIETVTLSNSKMPAFMQKDNVNDPPFYSVIVPKADE